ncbi:hypothetical protein H4582DRAFT_2061776 [Lactarius indigo]|nr:hypothetical protein H4582DRAFT_2061776 [Lactarius indigo]
MKMGDKDVSGSTGHRELVENYATGQSLRLLCYRRHHCQDGFVTALGESDNVKHSYGPGGPPSEAHPCRPNNAQSLRSVQSRKKASKRRKVFRSEGGGKAYLSLATCLRARAGKYPGRPAATLECVEEHEERVHLYNEDRAEFEEREGQDDS